MSNRSPLNFIDKKMKDNAKKFYTNGIGTDELTDLAFDATWKELEEDLGSDQVVSMLRFAAKAYARGLVSRIAFSDKCETGQIDFFRDYDLQFTVRKGKGMSIQVALGDLSLDTIPEIRAQKAMHLEAAKRSLAEFDDACDAIVPILQANPGWKWRQAAELILRSSRG
jgi:phosphoribosylformylglycinamidine (FGAM) synthase PurS component